VDFPRALLDWLHLRARSIPEQPRAVIILPEVEQQIGKYPAIAKIKNELSQGKDMTPWLSDSVRTKSSAPLADLMFNDWQIIHFSLRDFICRAKTCSQNTRCALCIYCT
jgi:hypothetical protein